MIRGMELSTQGGGWEARAVIEHDQGNAILLAITAPGPGGEHRTYRHVLHERAHRDYLTLFAALAREFGTRAPGSSSTVLTRPDIQSVRPLLTCNLSPDILYGYGDPAVLCVGDTYHLVVTSNDAPQSFPILTARSLDDWHLSSFVFPSNAKPAWATKGPLADYWAPELHVTDQGYILCYAARGSDGRLGIGLATAEVPTGPFHADPRPVLSGGVVDPHLYRGEDGALTLFWKEDSNDIWPSILSGIICHNPEIASHLFTLPGDVRTARLTGLLWPWIETLGSMERFQAQQTLIEAAVADFPAFRSAVERLRGIEGELRNTLDPMLDKMRTVIRAQPLDGATRTLTGKATAVIENDLPWEGHLVEGVWLWREDNAFYLFYSGNDFATAKYGIGVARGASPTGPFLKQAEPLLQASAEWLGLGHPSVALGPEGRPHLFFHGYRPDAIAYKEFRALLTAPLYFNDGQVSIGDGAHRI